MDTEEVNNFVRFNIVRQNLSFVGLIFFKMLLPKFKIQVAHPFDSLDYNTCDV